MFVGFNLEDLNISFVGEYVQAGRVMFFEQKKHVEKELNEFILGNGTINGTALQNDWFPTVKADVFLSHSHGDQLVAMAFAAMLKEEFGLTAFIDSMVWGHADNLVKQIDDSYSRNDNGIGYDYDKRNRSTSHVYTMLSGALTKMMDKAECLFFINTPNSLMASDVVQRTKSPWIFHEIATSSLLRKKEPLRYSQLKKSLLHYSAGKSKSLDIVYDLDLNHLKSLSPTDVILWQHFFRMRSTEDSLHPLDQLYKQTNVVNFKLEEYRGY
ncbi:TIR domain-containing protein [Bacillus sp. SLBN-3]